MFNKMKYASGGKKFFIFLFFAAAFVAFVTAVIWVVMYLWNAILPEVLGVKPVSFWQAAGILLLSKILFGGFSSGKKRDWKKRGRRKFKEKMANKWMDMEPEQREEMKTRWKAYCEKRGERQ